MPKPTNTERISALEEGCADLDSKIETVNKVLTEQFDGLKAWLSNGFSERVSEVVANKMSAFQVEILTKLLDEQKAENREYGRQKDAERERKTKVTLAIIAASGGIIGAMTALLTVIL